jgi:hypothetical protein
LPEEKKFQVVGSLTAVGNKLIKQAVAIAKSELPYDEKYFSKSISF